MLAGALQCSVSIWTSLSVAERLSVHFARFVHARPVNDDEAIDINLEINGSKVDSFTQEQGFAPATLPVISYLLWHTGQESHTWQLQMLMPMGPQFPAIQGLSIYFIQ